MLLWHRGARNRPDGAADQRTGDDTDRPAHQANRRTGPGAGRRASRRPILRGLPTSREATHQQQQQSLVTH
jgi:hypothetical protein